MNNHTFNPESFNNKTNTKEQKFKTEPHNVQVNPFKNSYLFNVHVHSEECVHNGHLISPLTRTQTSFSFFFLSVSLWRLLTNTWGEDKQTDRTLLGSICAANPPQRRSLPFSRLFEQFSRINTLYLMQTPMCTRSSVSLLRASCLGGIICPGI